MRSALLVAILVSASALLAGCADDKGHEHESYTCPDGTVLDLEQFPDHDNATFNPLTKCPKSSGTSTSQAPNKLPTLVLTVTDDGGNETLVTMLDGNLTFSAAGSSDSDGTITGIAVSVTDSNTTRTATLYDPAAKAFRSATFKFDRAGVVNVTVAMVDDRAGFTTNQSKVYVNHAQVVGPQSIAGGGLPGVSHCEVFEDALVDATVRKTFGFSLFAGATAVEATAVTTGAELPAVGELPSGATVAVCSPDGEELSEPGETTRTPPGIALPPPVGIETYVIGAVAEVPQSSITVHVVVHYEPQVAASAE